jgi:hypothetical protein
LPFPPNAREGIDEALDILEDAGELKGSAIVVEAGRGAAHGRKVLI